MDPELLKFAAENGVVAVMGVAMSAVLWQGVYILRLFVVKKLNGRLTPQPTAWPACAWSQTKSREWDGVVDDVRTIKHYQEVQSSQILSGQFNCAFKDRDEVRDVLELVREVKHALDHLTKAIEREGPR